jgi:large subunit ribosomal protein L15
MNLSTLKPAKGSRKDRKRIGRGPGSGHGKTSGKGHKGQKAMAGYSRKPGFEGGQMALARRIPKRGCTNIFRVEFAEVNLDRLLALQGSEFGPAEMAAARLIGSARERVKVLARGECGRALTVRAHKFSASAKAKIEKAGGQAVVLEGRP